MNAPNTYDLSAIHAAEKPSENPAILAVQCQHSHITRNLFSQAWQGVRQGDYSTLRALGRGESFIARNGKATVALVLAYPASAS